MGLITKIRSLIRTNENKKNKNNKKEEIVELFIKVVIIGDPCVGKTSILNKYANTMPSADNFYMVRKVIDYKKYRVGLKLIEACRENTSKIYRGADAYIIVFDLGDQHCLYTVLQWMREINRYGYDGEHSLNFILVGNKADLSNDVVIHENDVHNFFATNKVDGFDNMLYMETSVITGQNIENLFKKITKNHLKSLKPLSLS